MAEMRAPGEIDASFARLLTSHKREFVDDNAEPVVRQHGAAMIDASGFPGWVSDLACTEQVIETYVASAGNVMATSDNQPYVDAWTPLVTWLDRQVRETLARNGVEVAGDAYVTASVTATSELEGVAHMDDDTFFPDDPVQFVAIIGQLTGPRIATAAVTHQPLRPMGQVVFDPEVLTQFAANQIDHCAAAADTIAVFPQFGQLHAGPAADHVTSLGDFRQMLVYRATAVHL